MKLYLMRQSGVPSSFDEHVFPYEFTYKSSQASSNVSKSGLLKVIAGDSPFSEQTASQWASSILDFSSELSADRFPFISCKKALLLRKNFSLSHDDMRLKSICFLNSGSAQKILGPTNVYPTYAENSNAWSTADVGQTAQWITVLINNDYILLNQGNLIFYINFNIYFNLLH